ncbi:divergent PAP2 family protein [Desulfosporosinus sp. Sb-LF]|uniref:divergent PAP2 family protein n=1 Tax=Desulfosporosinus sp. Sb-LF TaxID=2560027 RepID=UPI00107FCADA|nr:divergent PAP2 family protein [Desulfosporosinus sp. Sb-LF]TGE31743.1 divergent PAP2 family protein [Desulfosporosinus sp. Sb-LF]
MFHNNVLLFTALFSAIFAQIIKVPINYWRNRIWDWKAVFQPGGMPSSHTALMVGLTTGCLFEYGWGDPYFAISFSITLIVMYDAAGVRRQAGQHAVVLNKLTSMFQNSRGNIEAKTGDTPLKEVLGHNPVEVVGGIIVGIITAIVLAI